MPGLLAPETGANGTIVKYSCHPIVAEQAAKCLPEPLFPVQEYLRRYAFGNELAVRWYIKHSRNRGEVDIPLQCGQLGGPPDAASGGLGVRRSPYP